MQNNSNKSFMFTSTLVCGVILSSLANAAPATPVPTPNPNIHVLGNELVRFGNTATNSPTIYERDDSVNSKGMMSQPFTYNDDANRWYRLAYSASAAFHVAIAVGGDGSENWNMNGSRQETSSGSFNLSDLVIDYSNYYDEGKYGHGEIIATGTFNLDNYQLEMKHAYRLNKYDPYIKVTSTLTNTGVKTTDNLRFWLGSRDDYVGTRDGSRIERGTVVNSQFTIIPDAWQQSNIMRGSSSETGLIFLSSSEKAFMVQERCCSFSNTLNQDPQTSKVDVQQDSSYALFVRMDDLRQGESESVTWYFGATKIADVDTLLENMVADLESEGGFMPILPSLPEPGVTPQPTPIPVVDKDEEEPLYVKYSNNGASFGIFSTLSIFILLFLRRQRLFKR